MKKNRIKKNSTRSSSASLDKFIRIMKIYSVLVALTIFKISATSLPTYGQKIAIDYNKATLKEIISNIEGQSEFTFFYNNTLVDENTLITVKASSNKINSVLDKTFKGTGISYELMNKKVILFKGNTEPTFKNLLLKDDKTL